MELIEALEHICVASGLPGESRNYNPHITVARHSKHKQSNINIEPISWVVSDFVLLNSESLDGEIKYTEIAKWRLKSSNSI